MHEHVNETSTTVEFNQNLQESLCNGQTRIVCRMPYRRCCHCPESPSKFQELLQSGTSCLCMLPGACGCHRGIMCVYAITITAVKLTLHQASRITAKGNQLFVYAITIAAVSAQTPPSFKDHCKGEPVVCVCHNHRCCQRSNSTKLQGSLQR